MISSRICKVNFCRTWTYLHRKSPQNFQKMKRMNTDIDIAAIYHKYLLPLTAFFDISNAYCFHLNLKIVAATVKLMLTFQFGIASSFTGIINAALGGNSNEHNRNEILRLTGAQSSWLGTQIQVHLFSIFLASFCIIF